MNRNHIKLQLGIRLSDKLKFNDYLELIVVNKQRYAYASRHMDRKIVFLPGLSDGQAVGENFTTDQYKQCIEEIEIKQGSRWC